jgi:circadian clock protein KaiC
MENLPQKLQKCVTHIKGLDQLLEGGLPAGRSTLIIGGPGSGKSLFGLEFLYRSALLGESGIFISFEERVNSLRDNALTLGWDLAALEKNNSLFLMEARPDPKAVVTGEIGIQPFLAILDHKIKQLNANLIVIDAIDVLMRLINDENSAQNELLVLHQWMEQHNITFLLTVKLPRDSGFSHRYDFLDYMADCVIYLDNRMLGQLSTRRLRVGKYRGSGFGSNEYPFVITPPGINMLPISGVTLAHQALGENLSTGVPNLDSIMGGGYRRASSMLISGSSGSGKTTLCSAFSKAACERGEKVLFISFEESAAALVSAMLSSGIDLRSAIAANTLRMHTVLPESMGAEQHLLGIFNTVEQFQPNCVVIESASACQRMGTEQAAFEFLMRLINFCKEQGITIFTTNQTNGYMNQEEISGIGISSIVDAIIILRLVDEDGSLQRKLLVMKSRGSNNSMRYHDFKISGNGIEIARN